MSNPKLIDTDARFSKAIESKRLRTKEEVRKALEEILDTDPSVAYINMHNREEVIETTLEMLRGEKWS